MESLCDWREHGTDLAPILFRGSIPPTVPDLSCPALQPVHRRDIRLRIMPVRDNDHIKLLLLFRASDFAEPLALGTAVRWCRPAQERHSGVELDMGEERKSSGVEVGFDSGWGRVQRLLRTRSRSALAPLPSNVLVRTVS